MKTTALNAMDEIIAYGIMIPAMIAHGMKPTKEGGKSTFASGVDTFNETLTGILSPDKGEKSWWEEWRAGKKEEAERARHHKAMEELRKRGGEIPPSTVPPQSSMGKAYGEMSGAPGSVGGITVNVFTDSQDPHEHGRIVAYAIDGVVG